MKTFKQFQEGLVGSAFKALGKTKLIHEKYDKVVKHLIDEKYAVDKDAADKIISGMSQDWYDTIAE